MKKQLLFTIVFLGAITFSFAQTSEASFDEAGADLQTFTVGQQGADDINDPNIVTLGGTGILVSNNKFYGIASASETDNAATGSFTFTVTTNSATEIQSILNLTLAKRGGCNVSGKVSVTGYPDTSFAYVSDGTTGGASPPIDFQFGSMITVVSGSPLTVTITLDEMLNVDNTVNPIFRLEEVIFEKDGFLLSIDDINIVNNISLYPNPVTNSFQLSAIKDIKNVQIYGITGSLLKTFNTQSNYDISDLATGVYIANIKTQLGSKTIRIVKN